MCQTCRITSAQDFLGPVPRGRGSPAANCLCNHLLWRVPRTTTPGSDTDLPTTQVSNDIHTATTGLRGDLDFLQASVRPMSRHNSANELCPIMTKCYNRKRPMIHT